MQNLFNELLDEYRAHGLHFLNIKTHNRTLFFVLDDSYYLTYRDEAKESCLVRVTRCSGT